VLDIVSLSYVAADGCPSRETFIQWVERRGGDPAAPHITDRRAFEVEIRRRGERYVGTLTARLEPTEQADPRTVEGETCEEVAEALSMTLALELEGAGAVPAPSPPAASDAPPPVAPSVKPPPVAAFSGASRWGRDIEPVKDGSLRFDPKFAVTVSIGASFGLVSLTATRYDAVFRMTNFVTLPDGKQRIIGPILRARLGFMGSPQSDYESEGAAVTISGQSLGLGLCWSPHYDADALVLLGCGELGLAGYATHVEEGDGAERDSSVQLLGTVGPVIDAEYSLGPLQVGARIGGNLMFGTLDARAADGRRVFQSRRWETYFTIGVGGHW
jgi:hypothetical protein